jgi:hypothetical protein
MILLLMAALTAVMSLPAAAADYSYQIVDLSNQYSVDMEFTRPVSDAMGTDDPLTVIGSFAGGWPVDINNSGLALMAHDTDMSCSGESDLNKSSDFLTRPFVWNALRNRKAAGYSYNSNRYPVRLVYDINNSGEVTGFYMDPGVSYADPPIDHPFILSSAGLQTLPVSLVNRFNFANKFLLNDQGTLTANMGDVARYLDPKHLYLWDKSTALSDETDDIVPYLYGGEHTHPLDMNENNIVVGWAFISESDMSGGIRPYAAYNNGTQIITTPLPLDNFEGEMSGFYQFNEVTKRLNLHIDEQYPEPGYDGIPKGLYDVAVEGNRLLLSKINGKKKVTYYLRSVKGGSETLGGTWKMEDENGAERGWTYCFDDEGNFIVTNKHSIGIACAINKDNTILGAYVKTDDAGNFVRYAVLVWEYNEDTGQWDIPTILPQYTDPAAPGVQHYSSGVDIADNGKILGSAGQMAAVDGYPVMEGSFPVVWEPDTAGNWQAPIKLADRVTGLPSADELSFTVNFRELLQANFPTLTGQELSIAMSVLSLEKMGGLRMSDNGTWIIAGALANDIRDVHLVGNYITVNPESNQAGDMTLSFLDQWDKLEWYNTDPMRLVKADSPDHPATISYQILDASHLALTVNGIAYNGMLSEELGDPADITGNWTVTDAGGTLVYSMRFNTDASFRVARLTPEPLKRVVPVVLQEGGATFCTEGLVGDLDIMTACQNSDNIVRVPVQINSAPNGVSAMGFDVVITPEEASVEFLGIEPGELIDAWLNSDTSGLMPHYGANLIEEKGLVSKVRVGAYAYNKVNEEPLKEDFILQGATGTVCYLLFRTPVTQCISFTLENENLKDDVSGWDATGGCIQNSGGSSGDINGDGELTPRDALCAFQRAVNDDEGTDCGTCSVGLCDVTMDCECTAADPLCILNAYLVMVGDDCAQRLVDGMAAN